MSNDIFDRFTKNAQTVLTEAQKIADKDHEPITTEYILLSIIQIPGTLSHDILREYSVTYDQIRLVLTLHKKTTKFSTKTSMAGDARECLKLAFKIASDFNHFNVDTEHILIALLTNPNFGSYKTIEQVGIDPVQIKDQLINIFGDLAEMDAMIKRQGTPPSPLDVPGSAPVVDEERFKEEAQSAFSPQMQKFTATKTRPAKLLEYFGVNLVDRCKNNKIDPVIGREKEINRAIQILLRKAKNNPVFIGEPGVGKTAIVEGLAQRICKKTIPRALKNKKIYQLDLGLLVAGTMYRGQFEDRLKKILAEIKDDQNIILFIDELHSIVGTGSAEGSMDAANLLKPALARGEIRLIGATTYDEYRKHIEKDLAFERRLQPIKVEEPSIDETVQILEGIKSVYEKHHNLKIEKSAIDAAVQFSEKYINDRFLPDKAIDLIDEASAAKTLKLHGSKSQGVLDRLEERIEELSLKKERLISEEKFEEAAKTRDEEMKLRSMRKLASGKSSNKISVSITDYDIAKLVEQITGVPVGSLEEKESNKFLKIESELKKHIVSQREAIEQVSKALRRNRSGLSSHSKPIGSFIFMGPSGVGKTELARALAQHIYGRSDALVKIDMSEFMERHNVARLTGAPPGYVGFDEAGKLTEAVRKKPYSIILFDEIEKAHPDVFNILLQILDEGKLTDAKGRVVDFKNTIVILTSNIGIEQYRQLSKIGFNLSETQEDFSRLKEVISKKLFDVFRPELINRLDKVIIFDPLTKEDLVEIAKLLLSELTDRLKLQNINATFTEKAIKQLVEKSYDPSFGARPLKREIEEKIESVLSDGILSGEFTKLKKITVDYKNGRFIAG